MQNIILKNNRVFLSIKNYFFILILNNNNLKSYFSKAINSKKLDGNYLQNYIYHLDLFFNLKLSKNRFIIFIVFKPFISFS